MCVRACVRVCVCGSVLADNVHSYVDTQENMYDHVVQDEHVHNDVIIHNRTLYFLLPKKNNKNAHISKLKITDK